MVSEAEFQTAFLKRLKRQYEPNFWALKNDTSYQQGIPDWTVFIGPWWGWLEIKKSKDEPFQPNQQWFIDEATRMSFGAVVYPENEEEVLNAIQRSLQTQRHARLIVESQHPALDSL